MMNKITFSRFSTEEKRCIIVYRKKVNNLNGYKLVILKYMI